MQTSSSGKPSMVKFSPNCPWTKSFAPELALPVAVGVGLVDEDGAHLAPCPARSPCPSPSTLSFRTRRGPSTGSLNTPVNTVLPCHGTSLGIPTLTERSLPAGPAIRGKDPTTQHPSPSSPSSSSSTPAPRADMMPRPDHGEQSYRGSGRLEGRRR